MKSKWPYFVTNQPQAPNADLEVKDKYTGEVATRVAMADAATIDRAIAAAVDAAEPMRPSWRVDNMPYGGVKDSGLGREGIRFAMDDMTEIRNLVIRAPEGMIA
jgi:acyl-CoA reductase-like NAD-dependent aldehyde dehydrogenase